MNELTFLRLHGFNYWMENYKIVYILMIDFRPMQQQI